MNKKKLKNNELYDAEELIKSWIERDRDDFKKMIFAPKKISAQKNKRVKKLSK